MSVLDIQPAVIERALKPRNFLISYSGRVGSTALIDTLKMIQGFLVPIFEDLDFWWIEQQGLLDTHNHNNIDKLVDYIYRNVPEGIDAVHTSVGFKWRIWGNMDNVSEVLQANHVVVLNMVRSDILEFASSLYLTDVVHKQFNAPQFLLRDATSDEERMRLMFRYRIEQHSLDVPAFFRICEHQLELERQRCGLLSELRNLGCPVYTILYEDFAYKRFDFLNALLSLLAHPPMSQLPTTKLTKVSTPYPSELFINRQELLDSPQLMHALWKWREMTYGFGFEMLECRPKPTF